jgi:hypothetical protein
MLETFTVYRPQQVAEHITYWRVCHSVLGLHSISLKRHDAIKQDVVSAFSNAVQHKFLYVLGSVKCR